MYTNCYCYSKLSLTLSFSFVQKQKPNKQQPSALEVLTNRV